MLKYSDRSHEDPHSDSSSTPLLPIGIAIFSVLMVPIVLYSVGPEGPMKAGDVVFATGRHRVPFHNQKILPMKGYQDFCILESRVQLVVQQIHATPESMLVAEPIERQKVDAPFCPPRTPVLLKPYQATLKADLWEGVRDTLGNLFSRR